MSKIGPDTNPASVRANGFAIEASPPNAGTEHPSTVRLAVEATDSKRLSGAGFAAVLGQFATYLASAKVTAIYARCGAGTTPGCQLTAGGGWIDILPEDGPTQITALIAILALSTNVQ